METITIKNSIVKNLTFTLSSLFFVMLSLFFFYFPNQPIFNYLGGFGLLFFGFLSLVNFGQIFNRQPRLVINSEGVFARFPIAIAIDGYDIKNVYLQKIGESRYVCFILEDEEKYLSNDLQENTKITAIKSHFGMENININIDGLDIDDNDLIKILKKEISRHDNPPKQVSIFDYDETDSFI